MIVCRRRRPSPEEQRNDPHQRASGDRVLVGHEEGDPQAQGDHPGDRVHVHETAAHPMGARTTVRPGQPDSGQDDNESRESGQDIDDDRQGHDRQCALVGVVVATTCLMALPFDRQLLRQPVEQRIDL